MRPAFQFYPGDWQRDAALRSCSVGARGLWIEMICVMHQAEPYGVLLINGRPVDTPALSRIVGATTKEVTIWLAELEAAGVFTRIDGAVTSRRMVRDERIRNARASGGKLGGNPALMDKAKVDRKVNLHANLAPTPSSSSSSSTSSNEDVPPGAAGPPAKKPRSATPKPAPMPDGFALSPRVREWAKEHGHGRLDERFDHFVMACQAKGYTYVDWDAGLMKAIRENWAKLSDDAESAGEIYVNGVKQLPVPDWMKSAI